MSVCASMREERAPRISAVARFFCGFLLALICSHGIGGELEVVQDLGFGVFAVRDNEAASTLRIRHRGVPVSSIGGAGGILVVAPGEPGRYRLSGFPPEIPLDVEIVASDVFSLGGQGGGEHFTLEAFTHDVIVTDALGQAELLVGATARTSGSGAPYAEGLYSGLFEIEVRYWSLPDQAYLTRSFGVFARGEIRSTLVLEQIDPLRFGGLSAFADPVARARFIVGPRGATRVENEPPASIGVVSGAHPGRIRVSGAAPLQTFSIAFEPPEIQLMHSSGLASLPRFSVREFTHYPTGLAFRADANGVLEFSVGATLETELTDHPYPEGDYQGFVTIVIDY